MIRQTENASRKTAMRAWYLVYCKPRQENVARENLIRQGYEIYLPIMREVRRRLGKRLTRLTPMFPRYLFIHLDHQKDNWSPVRSTLGVVSIVKFGRNAARVPDELLSMLRLREDQDGIQILPVSEYKIGRRIRITQGGFAGYEGVFQATSGHDRVTVLLDILGRKARTTVNSTFVEPA